MPIKTVKAHPEIIRRVGLGAQQCERCGQVYRIDHVPDKCVNEKCPTNEEESDESTKVEGCSQAG